MTKVHQAPEVYEAPTVTDITTIVPRRAGRWRQQAAIWITAVIVLSKDTPLAKAGDVQALKRLKAAIRNAYPFGERAYHPYKAWLDEVKAQLEEVRGGKRATAAEDIRYRLVGGKPPEEQGK